MDVPAAKIRLRFKNSNLINFVRLFHGATEIFGHCFKKVFLSLCESLECKTLGLPLFLLGFPGGSVVKHSACQCRRHRFDPWFGKI